MQQVVEYLEENANPFLHYFPMYPQTLGDAMQSIVRKKPNPSIENLSIEVTTGKTSLA